MRLCSYQQQIIANANLVFLVPTCHVSRRSFILQSLRCFETARQITTRKCFILCNSDLVACVLAPQCSRSVKHAPSPFPCSSVFAAFSKRSTEAREKATDWTVTAPTLLFPLSLPWVQWYPAKSKQLFSDVDFVSSQVKKKKKTKLSILFTSLEVKGILCTLFHSQWKKRAVIQSIFTGQTD